MATRHMLSFDVEEYFQCEAFRQAVGPQRWCEWPSRVECQVDDLLELLGSEGVKATFFVLGTVAAERPALVKRIAADGHEIASHGHCHEMIARLGEAGFAEDTHAGKSLLEDLTGQKVLGYRAATFGLTRCTAWAIDILAEQGFEYDSSVQPVRHDRYGVPDAPPEAHLARGPGGATLLEIPPMTRRVLGQNFPLGGGGYFRLLPTGLFHRSLKAWSKRKHPSMLYLHPWEFDPDQPVIKTSAASRFRHRVNLHRTGSKLRKLMNRHSFAPVSHLLAELKAAANMREAFHYA